MKRNRKPSWIEFKRTMLKQFQPFDAQIKLRADLAKLKQSKGQYLQYLHDFNRLINRVTDMTEADKMDKFINGLQTYTIRRIRESRPRTQECIDIASGIEVNYDNSKVEVNTTSQDKDASFQRRQT